MRQDLQELLRQYDADHQHPLNRRLHLLGITLIGGSVPSVWVAPALGVTLFVAGWAAQLAGHAIEGKPPSFSRDRRFMAVGAVWYAREVGVLLGLSRSSAEIGQPGKASPG
jgi:uncharacterized membrane protein YGL010W